MEADDVAERARQRELVRRGYDTISVSYRSDDGAAARSSREDVSLRPSSLDAVVSFYALIHVPLADQRALFPRIRGWLRPGGYLLAIVGADRWTGTERYLGADMFWDHADSATYLRWFAAARLVPIWHRFISEGDVGHGLILARAAGRDSA
jgi:Methyltransferase domain